MCMLVCMFGAYTYVYVNGVQNGLGLGCWTCWPARQVAHTAALGDKSRLNRLLVRWDERDVGFVRHVEQKEKRSSRWSCFRVWNSWRNFVWMLVSGILLTELCNKD
jgi:hypothetical protein